MKVSICVCAYNEEQNIGRLLSRLVRESLLDEITVVCSGCTDKTMQIACSFAPRVKTIAQISRAGKASAINEFLKHCDADVVILESADTLPGHKCFEYLLQHFSDAKVGMVGAHPIPTNSRRTLMGRVSHLIWQSHHELALKYPKAGEVVAFRKPKGFRIDDNTAVDEAYIEHEIVKRGLRVIYEPRAIIFNRGPETARDFVKQRKRIYSGHKTLKRDDYEVSTMSSFGVLKAALAACKNPATLLVGAVLEFYCRLTAPNGQETIWEMVCTTKSLR